MSLNLSRLSSDTRQRRRLAAYGPNVCLLDLPTFPKLSFGERPKQVIQGEQYQSLALGRSGVSGTLGLWVISTRRQGCGLSSVGPNSGRHESQPA